MTKHEKLIMQLAIGQRARHRSDARICRECNRVVDGQERQHCGKLTWEFRSKYLRRFPRLAPQTKPDIPEHIINREYPYHPRVVLFSGQFESARRRH
jgi:hypothetical protein